MLFIDNSLCIFKIVVEQQPSFSNLRQYHLSVNTFYKNYAFYHFYKGNTLKYLYKIIKKINTKNNYKLIKNTYKSIVFFI